MTRTFEEWWATLSPHLKQKMHITGDKPLLNQINYIWVANIINKTPEKLYPTVLELLEWIVSDEVDAIRK